MNKRHMFFILLYFVAGIAAYGCTSSSTDSASDNQVQIDLAGSKQGQSVAFVDVDGDGIEDKVVGAPYASVSSRTGAVLVYKSIEAGYSSAPVMAMTGDDNFGLSVVNLGDVDGDHKDDFAVGAINGSGDTAASLSGTVTIYKGGSKWQIIKKLAGDGPMDKFGFVIAAGDLNNDGYNDIVVGAPFNTNDPSLYQQGAVYVYFGPDFTKRVPLYASKTNSGLGWAVAVGDINGDGIPDLLISASGKVFGFYGGGNFSPSINSPDVTITSSASGFGKAIAVVGDFDGDGKKEIAIGAPNATINGNRDTGSVYIVKGGAGNRTVNLNAATTDLIVRIDGSNLFDRFGSSIAVAGDLDGDGKPEFAVGAPMADVNVNDLSGKVYLFKGKDINPSTTLSSSTAFNGMTKNQALGTALAANKKGHLLIGGPRSNADTGGVMMVDVLTGSPVSGGSSGGSTAGGGECH
jgi:hypothetical protein